MFINDDCVPEEKLFLIKYVRRLSINHLILRIDCFSQRGHSSIKNEWKTEDDCQRLVGKGWQRMVGKFMDIWNRNQKGSVCEIIFR